ncbi:hypothetical protein PV416_32795 [Streptomyces ipomoeae]|uniref:hypothetical protein n=1 Tax=Streptomyces ipomoeae TaxID=103232 RepID=UPI0029BCE147|nr:hypothetical protein [Streptomyces ipomoeae]MDX2825723.1 hypothetical protein [Streptomyces ipomoeae]MDX2875649.1 hypothetical protein [Streptomyces ipomoeae]
MPVIVRTTESNRGARPPWAGPTVVAASDPVQACVEIGETRTAAEAIVSLLAGLPGFSEERAASLVARHATEATT